MAAKYIVFFLFCQSGFCLRYLEEKFYPVASSRHQSYYAPIPSPSRRVEYQVPDYDNTYVPSEQIDFDYYDKYDPYLKYGGRSLVPFYQPRQYYVEKAPRKNWESVNYYDDPVPQDPVNVDVDGTYGDAAWYDDPTNAETTQAFINNLILAEMYENARKAEVYENAKNAELYENARNAEMYENARSAQPAYRYEIPSEDYNDGMYEYGIPTHKVGEHEKVRKYFDENEDVKELEALVGKQEKNAENKDNETEARETTEKSNPMRDISEKPTKITSKPSETEKYFNFQKQLILNSRKSNREPVAEGLRLEKKEIYNPMSKFFDFETFPDESTTNSIKKLNKIKDKEVVKEIPSTSTTAAASSTTTPPRNPAKVGQKEVVLPRPSLPVRKPYPEISTRSMNPPTVYDTIKKLLNMEKEAENHDKAQPQKRFVDDPLIAELKELKKSSA